MGVGKGLGDTQRKSRCVPPITIVIAWRLTITSIPPISTSFWRSSSKTVRVSLIGSVISRTKFPSLTSPSSKISQICSRGSLNNCPFAKQNTYEKETRAPPTYAFNCFVCNHSLFHPKEPNSQIERHL